MSVRRYTYTCAYTSFQIHNICILHAAHTLKHTYRAHTLPLSLFFSRIVLWYMCHTYIHKDQIIWGDTLVGCVWYRYEFLVVVVAL